MINICDVDVVKRSILLQADNTKGRKRRYIFFSPTKGEELRSHILIN